MLNVTIVKCSACLIGTFSSLLEDSRCKTGIKENIMMELNNRTKGNATNISLADIPKLVSAHFKNVTINEINIESDFARIPNCDNKNSFGILLWGGDGNENSQHATRFVSNNNDNIILMDSTQNAIVNYTAKKLFEFSPKGFYLCILSV